MHFILNVIESLIHFIFLIIILATIIISWWLSRKYQERSVEFPWWKAGIILAIEILSWLAFVIFWSWVESNLWIIAIIAVIVIIILLARRRKKSS